jgi:hypothetical protein
MSRQHHVEFLVAPIGASSRLAPSAFGPRLKARVFAAGRDLWTCLRVIGQVRHRRDMLELAETIATTRPELSARLRRAAQGHSWS